MSNLIHRITRVCKAGDVFKVAGKYDEDLGWGNLKGLEYDVQKDWRLQDR